MTSKQSVLADYQAVNPERVRLLAQTEQSTIRAVGAQASKDALATTAVFPALMFVGYIGFWAVFRSRGGYQPLALVQAAPAAPARTTLSSPSSNQPESPQDRS